MQAKLDKMEKAQMVNLEDELQNFSYAFGVTIGSNLKTIGFDSIAYDAFKAAMQDAMQGKEKISLADAQKKVTNTVQKREEEKNKAQKEKGARFLAKNAKRPEITTTTSGLQYEVIKKGDGAIPTAAQKVKVHYTGQLIDGTVFDSSVERGEPIVFGVTGVIKGWQEALQIMPVGSTWKVYIPYDLAYGKRGAGNGLIPPYAPLIFEMQLLNIE